MSSYWVQVSPTIQSEIGVYVCLCEDNHIGQIKATGGSPHSAEVLGSAVSLTRGGRHGDWHVWEKKNLISLPWSVNEIKLEENLAQS